METDAWILIGLAAAVALAGIVTRWWDDGES